MVCLQYVCSTSAVHVHYIYITFALHLYYIYITFTLPFHYIYSTFTLHLQYIHIKFTWHLHYSYITFTLQPHYIYITFKSHLHYSYIASINIIFTSEWTALFMTVQLSMGPVSDASRGCAGLCPDAEGRRLCTSSAWMSLYGKDLEQVSYQCQQLMLPD